MCGWNGIFDRRSVEAPPVSKWNKYPTKMEICQTLRLDGNKKYRDAMEPIRDLLKKHFHLDVIRRRGKHHGRQKPKYVIEPKGQQELYQLLRNKYRDDDVGARLKKMEDDGTFFVDKKIEAYWKQFISQRNVQTRE